MAQSNAITFRMPYGIPGDISRMAGQATVKAEVFGATAFASYGIPAKLSSSTVIPLALVGDTAPYGWLVRPFPTQGPNASDPLGTSVPPTSGLANIMLRGYIAANVQAGASSVTEGSTVYVRYANPSGSVVVGGIEGASVGGSNVALTGCYFTGPTDAANNTEVAVNI